MTSTSYEDANHAVRNKGEASWLLVAGAPRSGTTYLGRLIASHPEVALFSEGDLETVVALIRDILTTRIGAIEPRAPAAGGQQLRRFAKSFYEARFNKCDVRFIGDKQPVLPEVARRYSTMLEQPIAQIYIVRAPSDVIASSLVRAATPDDPWHVTTVEEAIVEWVRHYEQTAVLVDAPDVLIVSYDRFKSAPAAVIGAIAAFLGVDGDLFVDDFMPRRDVPTLGATAGLLVASILGEVERALLADLETCLRRRPAVYLPLPCRKLLPINRANVLTQLCLKRGWGDLEEHGAWTIAAEAEIAFKVDKPIGTEVTTTLYLVGFFGDRSACDLVVSCGTRAHEHRLELGATSVHEITASSIVGADGIVSMVLTMPGRKGPAQEPLHDKRELGVLLQGIVVA